VRIPFDPTFRLVRVPVILVGEAEPVKLLFAVDTGATRTVVSEIAVRRLGIDTDRIPRTKTLRGATGPGAVGEVALRALSALGRTWDAPTLAFRKLGTPSVDGLIGLDFFRGRVLTVDFVRGSVALKRPAWWRFGR